YQNNIMVINGPPSQVGTLAGVYVNGYKIEIPLAYEGNNRRTYLWDLNDGIPDSVDICTEVIHPEAVVKIPFQERHWITDGKMSIKFEDNTLLDDLFLKIRYNNLIGGFSVRINDPTEYLRNYMEVTVDASDFMGNKENAHVYLEYDNGH